MGEYCRSCDAGFRFSEEGLSQNINVERTRLSALDKTDKEIENDIQNNICPYCREMLEEEKGNEWER